MPLQAASGTPGAPDAAIGEGLVVAVAGGPAVPWAVLSRRTAVRLLIVITALVGVGSRSGDGGSRGAAQRQSALPAAVAADLRGGAPDREAAAEDASGRGSPPAPGGEDAPGPGAVRPEAPAATGGDAPTPTTASTGNDAVLAASPPPDPRILVVGDSVLLGARDDITARLAGWDVLVDAEVARSTPGGLEVIRRERARVGDFVVVHLGHNDGAAREMFRRRIDDVMSELAGVERVVWLNLAEFDDWVAGANEELAAAASRWPNLEIADWRSVAGSDPSFLYSDGIHLPPPGRHAMASLVGERLDAWVASRGPAELLAVRFASGDGEPPPRPRSAGLVAGPPVAVVQADAGWWASDSAGNVVASGGAEPPAARSMDPGEHRAVVGLAASPGGRGAWLVDDAGHVAAFGSARHHGDAVSMPLAARVTAIAATPTGRGYWLASADGGVFAFGDAAFLGSVPGVRDAPVIGIAARPDGRGYWLATSDGQVLAFGAARSFGDAAGRELAAPAVAITATTSGRGYWLLGADGGVFTFGDAPFIGSAAGADVRAAGIVPSGRGYEVVTWRPAPR